MTVHFIGSGCRRRRKPPSRSTIGVVAASRVIAAIAAVDRRATCPALIRPSAVTATGPSWPNTPVGDPPKVSAIGMAPSTTKLAGARTATA